MCMREREKDRLCEWNTMREREKTLNECETERDRER